MKFFVFSLATFKIFLLSHFGNSLIILFPDEAFCTFIWLGVLRASWMQGLTFSSILEFLANVFFKYYCPLPRQPSFFPSRTQRASLIAQLVKNLPVTQETPVWFLSQEDPLEKWKATHSSILAWRIPWIV